MPSLPHHLMGECFQTGQDVLATLRQLNHTPSPQLKAAERGWSKKAGRPQASAAAVARPAVASQPVHASQLDQQVLDLTRAIQVVLNLNAEHSRAHAWLLQ